MCYKTYNREIAHLPPWLLQSQRPVKISTYFLFFAALAEQRLGRHEQAIEFAENSVEQQPGWTHSLYLIANSKLMLGDSKAALTAIERATQINPFLTHDLYVDNLLRICGSEVVARPFTAGLQRL